MSTTPIDPISVPRVLEGVASAFDDMDFDALKTAMDYVGQVSKKPKTAAMVLAGGSGERFKHEGGKQLVEIAGMPMLARSIAVFDAVPDVGLIVVVCPEEREREYVERAVDPFNFVTPIVMAHAGAIRQESAFAGLEKVPEEYEFVLLHDGARPLINKELVEHLINVVKGNIDCDGAVVGVPSVDTLKVVENQVIVGTPDRSVFWQAQTPQLFRAGVYRRAHAAALSDGFVGTDDSSLIERLGGQVLMVQGKRDNIKLTVPEDYLVISAAIRSAFEERRKQARAAAQAAAEDSAAAEAEGGKARE